MTAEQQVLRWGVDFAVSRRAGYAGLRKLSLLLDRPELVAVTSMDLRCEVTFDEHVAAEQAAVVTTEIAARADLDGDPVLGQYPVGPLRLRCVPFSVRPVSMLALLRGAVLGGSSDGTEATFTVGSGSTVRFPAGYSAVDDPLTVLDERGRTVATIGDTVSGGGGWVRGEWVGNIGRAAPPHHSR